MAPETLEKKGIFGGDPVAALLDEAGRILDSEFAALPAFERSVDIASMERVLEETAHRLGDNYPYFHPMYAGQMLKPPHPVARAAYALAMKINPNNHSWDGGRASSQMEIEAVAEIARMFGWTEFLGHLASNGTLANLEALWVGGQLATGKRIVGSSQAHFTHERISGVLRIEYEAVPADARGRMDLNALEDELKRGNVGTVVVTLGTTAIGAVDPLDRILPLRERYGFRIHVDGAYGGYFRLIPDALEPEARTAFAVIDQADSIVIDPHKHGLQPYGCGCVLFRDPGVGRLYNHDSPYTYFTSNQLHLGEISLECSRAGAAAVALWATQRLLPLEPDGEFAQGLKQGRAAAIELDRRLKEDGRFIRLGNHSPRSQMRDLGHPPELDIVVWKLAEGAGRDASAAARDVFAACARRNLHLALVQLPRSWFECGFDSGLGAVPDSVSRASQTEMVTCLRSVLMKPEHFEWLDRIWQAFQQACGEALGPEAA